VNQSASWKDGARKRRAGDGHGHSVEAQDFTAFELRHLPRVFRARCQSPSTEIGYQKPSLFIANLRLQNFNDGEALTKGSANRDSFTRSLKSRSGMTSDDYLVESLARGRFFVHRNLDIRNGFLGARLAPDERSNASRVPAFRRERPTI
jgi:hypothetical protein